MRFTSESVSEGHPDKVADLISDGTQVTVEYADGRPVVSGYKLKSCNWLRISASMEL
jgi:hypothetical protein